MDLLFQPVSFWWPLCIGLVLVALEAFAPTTLFLWTGVASLLVTLPLAFIPQFNLLEAVLLWALLSVVAVLIARRYHLGHPASGDKIPAGQAPNQYGSEFVGQSGVLKEDSVNQETRIDIRGANWGVKLPGGDLKAGTRIRIKAVEGIFLLAEPWDA